MHLSKRLDLFEDEVFAKINERRQELERKGCDIIDLSVGTPDFEPAPHVIEALRASAADPANWRYALHDTPELKDAVCGYYERRFGVEGITPDMVMGCRGTQEGLVPLAEALVDPGDLVLIPDPCYPIFRGSAVLAGATPWFYPLVAEHGFLPYVAGIPDEVADRARYMLVSLPANPVGSVGTPEVYREIIDFARTHDILIIHDNAYSDIVFDGPAGGSFLSYPGAMEVGVEFNSLSKTYGMAGARVGFCLGNKEVVSKLKLLKSNMDYGMFLPIQKAAVQAITGDQSCVETTRQAYQKRRDVLCRSFSEAGWEIEKPKATMFVWAPIPKSFSSSQAFALELLERTGVMVTPGSGFGPSGEGYVRMALVQDEDEILRAAGKIRESGLFE